MAERSTLRRVFHRLSEEESKKAAEHAKKERLKSLRHKTTNREFAADEGFVALCKRVSEKLGVEVKPTARQASKYRNRKGVVYTTLLEE